MMRSAADGESVAGRKGRLRQQRSQAHEDKGGIHWARTLLARRESRLQREHLRFKPIRKNASVLHCVLLDCSASMMTAGQLAAAKGVLLDLGQQVYRQRDALAVIGFAGDQVQLLHDPHKASAWQPGTACGAERRAADAASTTKIPGQAPGAVVTQ